MDNSAIDKVSRALQKAREGGNRELAAAIHHDINSLYLPFEKIVEKHSL